VAATLRQLAGHVRFRPPDRIHLRELLGLGQKESAVVRVRSAPFSLMTQNMALVVFPADYLGTDRDGAIGEIVAQIRGGAHDFVGLCEVFADGEREGIRLAVQDLFPHFVDATDSEDLDSDGGQLILSRHPLLAVHKHVFETGAGDDDWANKGVIHVRVHPAGSPTAFDVFYTHMQAIYASSFAEADEDFREVLLAQLDEMRAFIRKHSDPGIPAFILGDLNVPGTVREDLEVLAERLGDPVDLWLAAGHDINDGMTIDQPQANKAHNFYADDDDNEHDRQRLDYILMRPSPRFVPIVRQIEVRKFSRNGRFISDHFGLHARIEELIEIVR
jgi:endonuclease/exonuclease/phosphatase family metal-dependent hydrolase